MKEFHVLAAALLLLLISLIVSGTGNVVSVSEDSTFDIYEESERLVALTFDDGPKAGMTEKLLDVLKEKGVKATFFMIGSQAEECPELVKRVAAAKGEPEAQWNGYRIFQLAGEGDPICKEAIDQMCDCLGKGISNICYVLNPQIVVLGGGIMAQEEYLRPRLEKALARYLVSSIYEKTELAFARHQNDAGMRGAYYHFLERQGKARS